MHSILVPGHQTPKTPSKTSVSSWILGSAGSNQWVNDRLSLFVCTVLSLGVIPASRIHKYPCFCSSCILAGVGVGKIEKHIVIQVNYIVYYKGEAATGDQSRSGEEWTVADTENKGDDRVCIE